MGCVAASSCLLCCFRSRGVLVKACCHGQGGVTCGCKCVQMKISSGYSYLDKDALQYIVYLDVHVLDRCCSLGWCPLQGCVPSRMLVLRAILSGPITPLAAAGTIFPFVGFWHEISPGRRCSLPAHGGFGIILEFTKIVVSTNNWWEQAFQSTRNNDMVEERSCFEETSVYMGTHVLLQLEFNGLKSIIGSELWVGHLVMTWSLDSILTNFECTDDGGFEPSC